MNAKTLPFFITSITYLVLGAWIILSQKNKAQRLYGALCIATGCWQGIWIFLFSALPEHKVYLALQLGYTGVVFIPAIVNHFIAEFTKQELRPTWVVWTYIASAFLGVSIWTGHAFLDGINSYSWGKAAKAGYLHPLYLLLIAFVVVRMSVLLRRSGFQSDTPLIKRKQVKWVMTALIIYSFGAFDLLSNYGISFFPMSSLFSGVAVILFAYAIFRYELLSIATSSESEDEKNRRIAASQEMKRLGMTTAFPLVSQGELLGYLLLGEKMSEESYSREDLLLLRIIANQAALAYQRVRYLELAVRGARTEMLGEIAGGFAHEIKTPLANISLPAELTYIDLAEVEQGKRKIEELLPELKQRMKDIMQQTFRASDKIEAIRQFSKPGQVKMEVVEIIKILQNSLSLLEHTLRKLGITLKSEFPVTISPVRGNAKQLEIVFVNLIKNAAEAMAGYNHPALARNLLLRGYEEGSWVILSVKDSGPGIKKTDIGHLFEAYFTTKGSSGTGMGLFLSHQVIKAHGGMIEVKSEEGNGTEFIVRLPKYVTEGHTGVHQAA